MMSDRACNTFYTTDDDCTLGKVDFIHQPPPIGSNVVSSYSLAISVLITPGFRLPKFPQELSDPLDVIQANHVVSGEDLVLKTTIAGLDWYALMDYVKVCL